MILKGKLTKLLPLEEGTSKNGTPWQNQKFIINTGSDYNPEICISAFGDMIKEIQSIRIGVSLQANVNIYSKEYNGKYYHNINLWKIGSQPSNEESNDNQMDDVPF
jgi:hypothetical protein